MNGWIYGKASEAIVWMDWTVRETSGILMYELHTFFMYVCMYEYNALMKFVGREE